MEPLIPTLVAKGVECISTPEMSKSIALSFQNHALVAEARQMETIQLANDNLELTDKLAVRSFTSMGIEQEVDLGVYDADDSFEGDDCYEFPIGQMEKEGLDGEDEDANDAEDDDLHDAEDENLYDAEDENSDITTTTSNMRIRCSGNIVGCNITSGNLEIDAKGIYRCNISSEKDETEENIWEEVNGGMSLCVPTSSAKDASLFMRILLPKLWFTFVRATHNGTCGFNACAIGLTALGFSTTTSIVMKALVDAAQSEEIRTKVQILEEREYGIIVEKYGKLPSSLSCSDWLKSRYYRLIALHFMVNIYVLMENDIGNFRLCDVHYINSEQPSIYILHSNAAFFDCLIPVSAPNTISELHNVMKLLLADAQPLVPVENCDCLSEIEPSKRKRCKSKVTVPVRDDTTYDSDDSDDEIEDVILEEGQQIQNQHGLKGAVTKVYVDSEGWHLYDVSYNNSKTCDKGLWGNQINAYIPRATKSKSNKTSKSLADAWDMLSVNSNETSSHIIQGKRTRKKLHNSAL